jgi:hypothetical protein
MSLSWWVILFAAFSVFSLWVLRWGGAERLEGWKSMFFIDWAQAFQWDAEQIKLYFLALWVLCAAWFTIGLFLPMARFSW